MNGPTLTWQTEGSALLSPCRTWRYTLTRSWGSHEDGSIRPLVVVGLNPSTADETQDDPTIRRCIDYARRWGYGALHMLNLFAYRSTDPKALKLPGLAGATGPENDEWLTKLAKDRTVLVAWGRHGRLYDRDVAVTGLLQGVGAELVALGLNKDGTPVHPLYQKKDAQPVPYDGKRRWLEAGLRRGDLTITHSGETTVQELEGL